MAHFHFKWQIEFGNMIILSFCGAYFFSLIFTANAVESNPICDCTNPVYNNQPSNIAQCYSKSKFYNQINANYDIVFGFVNQDSAKDCNYDEYKSIVNEMKKTTIAIVDSYFNCVKRDCLPVIMAAHERYVQILEAKFIPYLLCSYTYHTPECAVNIKHATYFSEENIMSTLIECANFKAASQRPDLMVFLNELLSASKIPDCNCVKIDQRPIPVSEEQCYSPEYLLVVKKFISDNFGRINEVYHNASIANPQCDYSGFIKRTNKLEKMTNEWSNIFQDSSPTFAKLAPMSVDLMAIAVEMNDSIRKYILDMEKDCYFTPRKVRQSALTISNYVLQILTKCVMYKDAANSTC